MFTEDHSQRNKRQKMDHPPAQEPSINDLYAPTLVNVVVSNSEVEGEDATKQTFQLPCGLLAEYSDYFKKMFGGRFTEANTKNAELKDVDPEIFRIFVHWLYFQKLARSPSTTPKAAALCLKSEAELFALPNDDEIAELQSQTPTGNDFNRSSPRTKMARADQSAAEAIRDNRPDEDVDTLPVTWPYSLLFSIYVFADKYDTRKLRLAALETVQVKLLQKAPRSYPLPPFEALKELAENVPPSSKLLVMLADAEISLSSFAKGTPEQQITAFCALPSTLVTACYVLLHRRVEANACQQCFNARDCDSGDHDSMDCRRLGQKYPCFYHEHGEDEEEAEACDDKWEGMAKRMAEYWDF